MDQGKAAPKLFFERTKAQCKNRKAGCLLDEYLEHKLTEPQVAAFEDHLMGCLYCSVQVSNRQALTTACERTGRDLADALTNQLAAARRMNLVIVDIPGDSGFFSPPAESDRRKIN